MVTKGGADNERRGGAKRSPGREGEWNQGGEAPGKEGRRMRGGNCEAAGAGRGTLCGLSFGKKWGAYARSLSTLKIAVWGTESESRLATSDSEPVVC